MPRLDRTYTGLDVIRFYDENLDPDEQARVELFFATLARLPEETRFFDDFIDGFNDIADELEDFPRLRNIVLRFRDLILGRD